VNSARVASALSLEPWKTLRKTKVLLGWISMLAEFRVGLVGL